MKRIFLCLIVFFVAAVLIPSSPAQPKLDRTTTIDVSSVAPRDVFASMSRLLGCELDMAPEIQKPVTMHLENVTVRTALTALSENLGCQWSIAGNTLRVLPTGSGKLGQVGEMAVMSPGRGAGVGKADFDKMLGCRTPSNFRFDNTSLGSVMDALGKVCNLDMQVEESEKARMVTMDLSNQKILSALKIIFEQTGPRKPVTITLGGPGSSKKLMLMGTPPKRGK
jgi:type II secretory pathway component GspD/PulD (secretin)